jgi:hypothetical protein
MTEPRGLLTKAQCRELGMTRPDVDRMFDRLPVVALPDSARPYVRVEDYEAWIDRHTQPATGGRAVA